ncbi:MAG: type III pantothenate kinase [Candidatus Kapabacteria bacterium]|nr:type III pantothenate kinase [Candidatus Kapabacteria bacterium]
MTQENKIAAIDIGNSYIKAIIESEKISCDYSNEWSDKISFFLDKNLPKNSIVGISSVQPERFNQLVDKIKYNYKIVAAEELLKNQNLINFDEIEGIGNDRLLGLIGALKKFSPPLITIDCGTAITINVLDEQRKCLGGTISAGIETQLEALSEKTAQLKKVDLFLENNIIGKNTESALRNGIIKGAVGSILYIIENIISQYDFKDDIDLILTGGTSKLILPLLEKSHLNIHFDENLVLNGLTNLIHSIYH